MAVTVAEEKPALLPLPLEPFRYHQYGEPQVRAEHLAHQGGGYLIRESCLAAD